MQAVRARLSTAWRRRSVQGRLLAALVTGLLLAVVAAGGIAVVNGRADPAARHSHGERQLLGPFRWGDPPPPNQG